MKKYINPILSLGTAAALLGVIYFQNERINKSSAEIKMLQLTVDSLRDEDFINKSELGRYELTLDHLQEVNPDAAVEFVNYMNHETE
jgi:hypothetical protein